jgi:hypothetical protein
MISTVERICSEHKKVSVSSILGAIHRHNLLDTKLAKSIFEDELVEIDFILDWFLQVSLRRTLELDLSRLSLGRSS